MKKTLLAGVALAATLAFAGAANAQLKFGVTGPITGPNAAFGKQLTDGAEQAAADFNAAGGIMGQRIALSKGDDVSDPKQGVSVANKFVGDGVKFVVGPFNSGVTIPSSEVYAENGILMITPSATNPQYGAQWWMLHPDSFEARGLFGQIVLVSQPHDLVLVITTTQGGDADTLVNAVYDQFTR